MGSLEEAFGGEELDSEDQFRELGEAFGLEGDTLDRYSRFMTERFGSCYWSYAKEWVQRFDRPEGPEYAMDEQSRDVYREVKRND